MLRIADQCMTCWQCALPLGMVGHCFACLADGACAQESHCLQDNTIADRPMMELLSSLMHMLDEAQHLHSSGSGYSSADLQQLVLIVADGRFHEKDGLKRLVTVSAVSSALSSISAA